MKISCQSCQSKYTIADDKVAGKVVKIRCKKCGATIVVNGGGGATGAAQSMRPEPPTDGGAWTVNVAEGDQRTMTDDEIVAAFHAGIVNEETFCWRDGMADWQPIRDIESLAEAVSATHAMQAPVMAPPPSHRGTNGSTEPFAAAPTATARRVAGRGPAGDLFSSAAQAGGEDEVMTSAPAGRPQSRPAPAHEEKMTGERNENSVLFSLSALTSKGTGPTRPTTPGVEASGLIDIRQLSAQLHSTDDKKKSRIDDIMNLAGGGAFSPSLSGPILSAPSVAEYSAPGEVAAPTAGQASKGRGMIVGAAAAGVLVIAGAIGTAVTMMKKPDADKDKTAASAGAMASAAPSASTAASAAPPSASVAAAAPPAPASAAAAPESEAHEHEHEHGHEHEQKAAAGATKAGKEASGAPAPKESSLVAAMAGGAAPAPAGGGGSDQPFNMGEARARLAAAASAAQGCKKGDISGTGHVIVVFAPSGAAQSATVTGPPFEGTPSGACVAARFRGVHVPAFSGSPFSVSKSFTIN
jgi:predicted Zn finger-like uncharacterized protein